MSENSNQCCAPPEKQVTVASDEDRDEQLAELAKAVGHPTRVAILRKLIERDECVCGELVDELPYAQSTVSGHLNKLKQAGLIRGEVDGPSVCYCIEPQGLELFRHLVEEL